jgi:hypothetical protein
MNLVLCILETGISVAEFWYHPYSYMSDTTLGTGEFYDLVYMSISVPFSQILFEKKGLHESPSINQFKRVETWNIFFLFWFLLFYFILFYEIWSLYFNQSSCLGRLVILPLLCSLMVILPLFFNFVILPLLFAYETSVCPSFYLPNEHLKKIKKEKD